MIEINKHSHLAVVFSLLLTTSSAVAVSSIPKPHVTLNIYIQNASNLTSANIIELHKAGDVQNLAKGQTYSFTYTNQSALVADNPNFSSGDLAAIVPSVLNQLDIFVSHQRGGKNNPNTFPSESNQEVCSISFQNAPLIPIHYTEGKWVAEKSQPEAIQNGAIATLDSVNSVTDQCSNFQLQQTATMKSNGDGFLINVNIQLSLTKNANTEHNQGPNNW